VAPFLQTVSMYNLGDFNNATSMQIYVKISHIFRCCKKQAEHLDLLRNGSVIKHDRDLVGLYISLPCTYV